MVTDRGGGAWIVVLSFFFAFVLAFVSLPDFVPGYIAYARPHWVALVLIYWILFLPQRIGLITAWSSGLIVDVLQGGLLGQHAMAYLVVGYIVANLYQRMLMFTVWKQASIIFAAIVVGDLILYLIDLMAMGKSWSFFYLLPPLVSSLLWPWLYLFLRQLRGQFNVY